MCKYCEIENKEIIIDDGNTYFYIMNNIGIPPQIMYGSKHSNDDYNHILINYCPFCSEQLVGDEDYRIIR